MLEKAQAAGNLDVITGNMEALERLIPRLQDDAHAIAQL
jgi:hypothetical protein